MNLSEKIYYCRKKSGMSQEALAERIGVSRQAVSKWETGDAEPEIAKLKLLAQEFGVSIDWMLSSEEPEEKASSEPAPSDITLNNLPGFIVMLAKRWGWLAGVYIAIGGAMFSGLGILGRVITKNMFRGFPEPFGAAYSAIDGYIVDSSDLFAAMQPDMTSNPVYMMCSFILGLGIVIMVAGIIIAVVLKKKLK